MNDKLRMSTSYEPEVDAMDSNFNENEIKFEYKKKVKSCLVCGDNAFYYFYGAITCDSCRTFFRRQILQFKPLKCPFSGNCTINNTTRKDCSKCRLSKCLQVGMRKDLIVNAKEERRRKHIFPETGGLHSNLTTDSFTTSGPSPPASSSEYSNYDQEYKNYMAYCARFSYPSNSNHSQTNQHSTAFHRFHPQANFVAQSSFSSIASSLSPNHNNQNNNNNNNNSNNNHVSSNASSWNSLHASTSYSPPFSLSQQSTFSIPHHSSISSQTNRSFGILNTQSTGSINCSSSFNLNNSNSNNAQFTSGSMFDTRFESNERLDRLDTSSCDSFPLDRSPGLPLTSESDCETWTGSCPISSEINYNWKKRNLPLLATFEKENQHFVDDTSDDGECVDCTEECAGSNSCSAQCRTSRLDAKQAKIQRLEEILNAAARIMKSPNYRLDRLDRLSHGAKHSQRLEALKWQFFGISKLSRAFIEIGSYRRLRDAQRRALLKANCTELLMLSSARYFDPESECWLIHVRLHSNESNSSASTVQLPVPVNVMDVGQAQELSQLYLRFMEQFDRQWLTDDVLMTLIFVLALFCPDARLRRQICHISFEYECYQSLLQEHLIRESSSIEQAKLKFDKIKQMFAKLADFKEAYENTFVPLDGEEKNLLYTHLSEQLAV